MMGRFGFDHCGSGLMTEFDGVDVSPAGGTGNGVCGRRGEDSGNGVCASWCGYLREDTGNRVCGRRDRWAASLRRGAMPLQDWWLQSAPTGPGVEAVAALSGWWHWKQGVSGLQPTAFCSLDSLDIWSGNEGWSP